MLWCWFNFCVRARRALQGESSRLRLRSAWVAENASMVGPLSENGGSSARRSRGGDGVSCVIANSSAAALHSSARECRGGQKGPELCRAACNSQLDPRRRRSYGIADGDVPAQTHVVHSSRGKKKKNNRQAACSVLSVERVCPPFGRPAGRLLHRTAPAVNGACIPRCDSPAGPRPRHPFHASRCRVSVAVYLCISPTRLKI